ncbi:MAG: AAA family ATPase [Acidobacteriota bacterium]
MVTHADASNGSSDEALERSAQALLVESLRHSPDLNPATNTERVTVIETHISYVLLAGDYAYKIKKAVNLQFLDFSTLASRGYYCQEELRLNRPLAPSVYLEVVPITGTAATPIIGGTGPVLEYALRMRRFSQDGLLSAMLARGVLTAALVDRLATVVAAFHRDTNRAGADTPYGTLDNILRPALDNFTQLLAMVEEAGDRAALESLRAWTGGTHTTSGCLFLNRRRHGFVRECHGDLHLGNIALVDGDVTLFDRLEFNESMRWTDVMNDVAFVVADLQERQRPDLAARFLTAYLEATGDYEGLGVLRFYLVYRAMVRAKVARFRLRQLASPEDREKLRTEYDAFIDLARRHSQRPEAAIIITHGLAGSGKTTCTECVVEHTAAVRMRTDVERKRLHGLGVGASSGSLLGEGIYSTEATRQTYTHVCALARMVAAAGFVAVVDGAFLKRWQRDLFRETAATLGLPFVILAVSAPDAMLRQRIASRGRPGGDASEATVEVLEAQRRSDEPLDRDEQPFVVHWDTAGGSQNPHKMPASPVLEALHDRVSAWRPSVAGAPLSAADQGDVRIQGSPVVNLRVGGAT